MLANEIHICMFSPWMIYWLYKWPYLKVNKNSFFHKDIGTGTLKKIPEKVFILTFHKLYKPEANSPLYHRHDLINIFTMNMSKTKLITVLTSFLSRSTICFDYGELQFISSYYRILVCGECLRTRSVVIHNVVIHVSTWRCYFFIQLLT